MKPIWPVGSLVIFAEPVNGPPSVGKIIRHGRDTGGAYTEIDHHGERLKVDSSQLQAIDCKACEGRARAGFDGQCPACANERAAAQRSRARAAIEHPIDTAKSAPTGYEIDLDGMLHVVGSCCNRKGDRRCHRCDSVLHQQGAYGSMIEACESCDAEDFAPPGTHKQVVGVTLRPKETS